MAKTLHIFNPGHDLALAADLDNFTPPHAARALRSSLDFLPALWASDGDVVLVDDIAHASMAYMRLSQQVAKYCKRHFAEVRFIEASELLEHSLAGIDPWGWDRSLAYYLSKRGVAPELLPNAGVLGDIRRESHRSTSMLLFNSLGIYEAYECKKINDVLELIYKYNKVVVKAPWSCSGRGIRFLADTIDEHTLGWLRNTIAAQKSVMVEPYYNKVLDFGLEFYRDVEGNVEYIGLSLFQTINGAYTGNLLATEKVKRDVISKYIPLGELDGFISKVIDCMTGKITYVGPFGIDMMVVEGGRLALAEINLRRTMGHVAIAISPDDDDIRRVMHIEAGNVYKLKILRA